MQGSSRSRTTLMACFAAALVLVLALGAWLLMPDSEGPVESWADAPSDQRVQPPSHDQPEEQPIHQRSKDPALPQPSDTSQEQPRSSKSPQAPSVPQARELALPFIEPQRGYSDWPHPHTQFFRPEEERTALVRVGVTLLDDLGLDATLAFESRIEVELIRIVEERSLGDEESEWVQEGSLTYAERLFEFLYYADGAEPEHYLPAKPLDRFDFGDQSSWMASIPTEIYEQEEGYEYRQSLRVCISFDFEVAEHSFELIAESPLNITFPLAETFYDAGNVELRLSSVLRHSCCMVSVDAQTPSGEPISQLHYPLWLMGAEVPDFSEGLMEGMWGDIRYSDPTEEVSFDRRGKVSADGATFEPVHEYHDAELQPGEWLFDLEADCLLSQRRAALLQPERFVFFLPRSNSKQAFSLGSRAGKHNRLSYLIDGAAMVQVDLSKPSQHLGTLVMRNGGLVTLDTDLRFAGGQRAMAFERAVSEAEHSHSRRSSFSDLPNKALASSFVVPPSCYIYPCDDGDDECWYLPVNQPQSIWLPAGCYVFNADSHRLESLTHELDQAFSFSGPDLRLQVNPGDHLRHTLVFEEDWSCRITLESAVEDEELFYYVIGLKEFGQPSFVEEYCAPNGPWRNNAFAERSNSELFITPSTLYSWLPEHRSEALPGDIFQIGVFTRKCEPKIIEISYGDYGPHHLVLDRIAESPIPMPPKDVPWRPVHVVRTPEMVELIVSLPGIASEKSIPPCADIWVGRGVERRTDIEESAQPLLGFHGERVEIRMLVERKHLWGEGLFICADLMEWKQWGYAAQPSIRASFAAPAEGVKQVYVDLPEWFSEQSKEHTPLRRIALFCAATPVELVADLQSQDGTVALMELKAGKTQHRLQGSVVLDGEAHHAFSEEAASEHAIDLRLELPARITLDLSKLPAEQRWLNASLMQAGRGTRISRARISDKGQISLWCPPGEAELMLSGEYGYEWSQRITIASQAQVVTAPATGADQLVEIELGAFSSTWAESEWCLYELDQRGYALHFITSWETESQRQEALIHLAAGDYALLPDMPLCAADSGNPALVRFTVQADTTQRLQVEAPDLRDPWPRDRHGLERDGALPISVSPPVGFNSLVQQVMEPWGGSFELHAIYAFTEHASLFEHFTELATDVYSDWPVPVLRYINVFAANNALLLGDVPRDVELTLCLSAVVMQRYQELALSQSSTTSFTLSAQRDSIALEPAWHAFSYEE